MAPSVKHLLFLLILLFLTFYCPQIQARESQFFSKFTLHHNNLGTNSGSNNNNIATSSTIKANTPTPTPTPTPTTNPNKETTTSFTPEKENGHGLYGDQGSTQFSPTTMTTTTTSLAEAPTDGDYIDATYEDNNNNNNNPDTLTEGPSETPTNEYTGATYEENENNNNNNWSKMMKKQGMSDTRFMENGRYFYHVNTNTNLYGNNEYRSPSLKGNNQEEFGSSSRGGGAGGRGEMDNYNAADNTFNDDEFNNYMEQDQFSDNINDQYVP